MTKLMLAVVVLGLAGGVAHAEPVYMLTTTGSTIAQGSCGPVVGANSFPTAMTILQDRAAKYTGKGGGFTITWKAVGPDLAGYFPGGVIFLTTSQPACAQFVGYLQAKGAKLIGE
jgi:hypothetical protein